jgi:hypothetical protein
MGTQAIKRALPGSYSELFPGRFLKADMLKGKKVTLTIKAIFGEDMTDADDNTKAEWIVQFAERPLEWVMNKTGAYCLYRMWGGDPHNWVGHRVTLFPQPGTWFGEKGEAIRVWGSPELAEDLPITLKFLRKKKDRNMVMHRVVTSNGAPPAEEQKAVPQPTQDFAISERMSQIFALLAWNPNVQAAWLTANANLDDAQRIAKLEKELE